jgi:hypothetical protein
MSTPSPTIPALPSTWADFFPDEIDLNTHSQYRAMAEEQATRDERTWSEPQTVKETQTARETQTDRVVSGSKRCKRINDTSMDELIFFLRIQWMS